MNQHLFVGGLAAALALTGCQASLNATVTPGTPAGTGATAGTTAGTGATTGTGATVGANVGANVSTGTGAAATGDAAAIYKVGRKWVYDMALTGVASSTGTLTWEVTKVEGSKATLKTSTAMGTAAATESTTTIDLAAKDPWAAATATGSDVKVEVTGTGNESITTPAGTFACVKTSSKVSSTVNGASSVSNSDSWSNAEVGLVKSVSVTKLDVAMPAMPNMGSLPGGMSLPGMSTGANGTSVETKSELVLKSYTK